MTKSLTYGAAFADVYDEWYGDGKAGARIAEILATARLTSDKQFIAN